MTRVTGLTNTQILAEDMSESQLQQNVIQLAHVLGYYVHAERSLINRRGQWATPIVGDPGYVDLTLARRGHLILAELKAQEGKLSNGQINWQYELFGRPGLLNWKVHPDYYIWYPSDWFDGTIERILKED
jgi:hypothetical protein